MTPPVFDHTRGVWVYEVTQGTHQLLTQYADGRGLEEALRSLLAKKTKTVRSTKT